MRAWLLLLCSPMALAQYVPSGPVFPSGGTLSFGTVDSFTHFTGQTAGTSLTTGILASGTAPSSSPPCTWTITGTNLKIGATQGGMGGDVTVGSTTYPAATTSTMSLSVPDAGSLTTAKCVVSSPTKQFSWFGYITNNDAIAPTSNLLYDRAVLTDNGGSYVAAQVYNGQQCLIRSTFAMDMETNPSGTTTHTGCFPIVPSQRYAVSVCYNSQTGAANEYIYLPLASGALAFLGSISYNYPTPPNQTVPQLLIGNNEGGTGSASFIEDSMLTYTVSNYKCPLVPGTPLTVPTYVSGNQVDNTTTGTTVAVTNTAKATSDAVVVFTCAEITTGTIGVTSTHNTWTQIYGATNITRWGMRCAAFVAFNVGTASDTITATYGTSNADRAIAIVELANVSAVDTFSTIADRTTTTGGAYTSASVTPGNAQEVGVAFGICSQNCDPGSGWAPITNTTTNDTVGEVTIITSTASIAANFLDTGASSGVTDAATIILLH